jgi:hypothetical protein
VRRQFRQWGQLWLTGLLQRRLLCDVPKIKAPLYLIRCADKAMYLAKKKDIPFYILSEQEALEIIEEDKKSNG